MVGDNATRLAVRLLGNIAQGKGSTLPLDTVSSLFGQSIVQLWDICVHDAYFVYLIRALLMTVVQM